MESAPGTTEDRPRDPLNDTRSLSGLLFGGAFRFSGRAGRRETLVKIAAWAVVLDIAVRLAAYHVLDVRPAATVSLLYALASWAIFIGPVMVRRMRDIGWAGPAYFAILAISVCGELATLHDGLILTLHVVLAVLPANSARN